jgi:hypothetical protein
MSVISGEYKMKCRMVLLLLFFAVLNIYADVSRTSYNVVWDSPSIDSNGTMPLGNGETGINAWFDKSGDLQFYISRTDAWDDNGRLVKVGKVRIKFEPAIYASGAEFKQTLDLKTGTIIIDSKLGENHSEVLISVNAGHSVIDVTQRSSRAVKMTAYIELWRNTPTPYGPAQTSDLLENHSKPPMNLNSEVMVEPDTVIKNLDGKIGWYHYNKKSLGFRLNVKLQGLSEYITEDPILHRVFGAVITGDNLTRIDDLTIATKPAEKGRLSIYLLTQQPSSPEEWLKDIQNMMQETEALSFEERYAEHKKWWKNFWDRSYIHLTKGEGEPKCKRVIPVSKHPVKIGMDQSGANKFSGNIARVSFYNKALKLSAIKELAEGNREKLTDGYGLIKSVTDMENSSTLVGKELDINKKDLAGSVTFEAWIKPEGGEARVVDMITPGGSDGFLFDTCPNGDSLRFIVGHKIILKKGVLSKGEWSHVAVVVDAKSDIKSIYLNGKLLVSSGTPEKIDSSLSDAFIVSRAYALQRFLDACAGRGHYPIKFNGSIFTVPHKGDPDYRRWGPGYWWQNTRLPYLSMCAAGDYDLMKTFFKIYGEDIFKVCKARTKKYFNHDGAYFPECMYFWGAVFTHTYGWTPYEERKDRLQQSGWHKWEWVAGPELAFMMLDYFDYTQDENFLQKKAIPVAVEVLKFFDEHYKTDSDGKLVMHPAMACVTWWYCTNPMPELAGIYAITRRLLMLTDKQLNDKNRKFCEQLLKKLPPLPTREIEGEMAFAPAEKFEDKHNCENPELYCVFPFRLASFEKNNAKLAKLALKHRWDKGAFGWRQDGLFMTYLGLADQARQNLIHRCKSFNKDSRFPAFWGPNFDWTPDQDHGGVMMKILQSMILQADPYSKKVYLAPALPADWNCSFKLHAPEQTIIEGVIKGGKITSLKVTPEKRKKDIVLPDK